MEKFFSLYPSSSDIVVFSVCISEVVRIAVKFIDGIFPEDDIDSECVCVSELVKNENRIPQCVVSRRLVALAKIGNNTP